MIKYVLICKNEHKFESWFSDSKEYEKLEKKHLLQCIHCNSKEIKKSIMAPMVKGSDEQLNNDLGIQTKEVQKINKIKKHLLKLRKYIEKNFTFVGDKLPQEIRTIYYNKKGDKKIYGTVSPEEREELKEEGIELSTIPWIDDKSN